jgi:hypothetical protein
MGSHILPAHGDRRAVDEGAADKHGFGEEEVQPGTAPDYRVEVSLRAGWGSHSVPE